MRTNIYGPGRVLVGKHTAALQLGQQRYRQRQGVRSSTLIALDPPRSTRQ
jgi:hypothetical protein